VAQPGLADPSIAGYQDHGLLALFGLLEGGQQQASSLARPTNRLEPATPMPAGIMWAQIRSTVADLEASSTWSATVAGCR
jgi:hypothetical protein